MPYLIIIIIIFNQFFFPSKLSEATFDSPFDRYVNIIFLKVDFNLEEHQREPTLLALSCSLL